jgi:hypothetical protein
MVFVTQVNLKRSSLCIIKTELGSNFLSESFKNSSDPLITNKIQLTEFNLESQGKF